MTSIGDNAFASCEALSVIYFEGSAEEWEILPKGSGWNTGCPESQEVECGYIYVMPAFDVPDFTLPDEIREIGEDAFAGTDMRIVFIPDGCDSIGSNAFKGCANLVQIRIPDSVKTIGTGIFEGCRHHVLVYGAADSAAEDYCRENDGCTFVTEE